MAFRDPVSSLPADSITPGTLLSSTIATGPDTDARTVMRPGNAFAGQGPGVELWPIGGSPGMPGVLYAKAKATNPAKGTTVVLQGAAEASSWVEGIAPKLQLLNGPGGLGQSPLAILDGGGANPASLNLFGTGLARLGDGSTADSLEIDTINRLASLFGNAVPFAWEVTSGTITVPGGVTNANGVIALSSGRFTVPPVIIPVMYDLGYVPSVVATTTTQTTINLRHIDASTAGATRSVFVIAVQMTPTAAQG